ncbi:hypothetical protein SAMN05216174_11329 [Actinokineospora iranica]|uniref:Uncharacterized protein n=1 Tax=Actinokineospora iranica TaxID=1271860 RepID=A0A1G6VPR7_9PSEU|nr:hypothetical protein SAMN05216174_11329 [Actinokineospora iranica]
MSLKHSELASIDQLCHPCSPVKYFLAFAELYRPRPINSLPFVIKMLR